MSDPRDTNKDGKVSLMEKVKDKLHGHKDADHTTTTAHSGAALPATGAHTHTTTGYTTGGAIPATGVVPVVGAVPVAIAAVPIATGIQQQGYATQGIQQQGYATGAQQSFVTGAQSTSGASYDSRDSNRDGHVSTGEKLAASTHHTSAQSTTGAGYTTQTGAGYDSRDLNRDGHVSTGERLAAGSHLSGHQSEEEMRLRLHEEQLAISKREVGAGEVDIHKRVHEQHVQQTVPVRREEVTVERRPLSGVAEPGARIAAQDETMRVALFREEIVTEKRIVPTEEVIVRKKEVVDQQTVGATLRSEHVETVQTGTHSSSVLGVGGVQDSRDLNRDGHVSTSEKLRSDVTGAHATSGAGYDSRDLNGNGKVSLGEKIKAAPDTNGDGHVSAGEKLKSAARG